MSSYTTDHKYRSRYASTKAAGELKYCNLLGVFNKTIIPHALVGYEIVIANSYPMCARGIIVKYLYSSHSPDRAKDQKPWQVRILGKRKLWIINLLLDILVCSIAVNFYSSFLF